MKPINAEIQVATIGPKEWVSYFQEMYTYQTENKTNQEKQEQESNRLAPNIEITLEVRTIEKLKNIEGPDA